tara:strand:+ start:5498 stop:6313 length:816 start_codon:yes stop_codon:yes gene_type:complete
MDNWKPVDISFWTNMKNYETIGTTMFKVNHIDETHSSREKILDSMNRFFIGVEWRPNPYQEGILTTNDDDYYNWQMDIETFAKSVWLTNDFITNNFSFENPIMIHWNKRERFWKVHPGGTRQFVIKTFSKESHIEVICFNNSNNCIKWKKIFHCLKDISDYFNNSNIWLVTTKEHDTYIPHVHFETDNSIDSMVEVYFKQLKQFYNKNLFINSNINLKDYVQNFKTNTGGTTIINLTIKNPCVESVMRALILMPLKTKHSDNDIEFINVST